MPNIEGIQSVLSRIQTIESQFKQRPAAPVPGQFDAQMKQAMGMGGMSAMGSPDSIMALMNSQGMMNSYGANMSNAKLTEVAKNWSGREFKPGMTCRCADWVSSAIEEAGVAPANFQHEVNCERLQEYGRKIDRKDLQPGDVIYFGNTYCEGPYTHVGIYIGDNKFVHRPTSDQPVRTDTLEGYYEEKFAGGRRLNG